MFSLYLWLRYIYHHGRNWRRHFILFVDFSAFQLLSNSNYKWIGMKCQRVASEWGSRKKILTIFRWIWFPWQSNEGEKKVEFRFQLNRNLRLYLLCNHSMRKNFDTPLQNFFFHQMPFSGEKWLSQVIGIRKKKIRKKIDDSANNLHDKMAFLLSLKMNNDKFTDFIFGTLP